VDDHGGDVNPGDGKCETTTRHCSLRAALEESNATSARTKITVAPDFDGGVIDLWDDEAAVEWMMTADKPLPNGMTVPGADLTSAGGPPTPGVNLDHGAVFAITSPVDLDLQGKVMARPLAGKVGPNVALFFIDADSVTVRGVNQSWTLQTMFYFGPHASNAVVDGGVDDQGKPIGQARMDTASAQRLFQVRGGAKNVTVQNYVVSGFAPDPRDTSGWGIIAGATAGFPVAGLTVKNMAYVVDASGSAPCDATGHGGCSYPIVTGRNTDQYVNDLVVADSTVTNFNRAGAGVNTRLFDLRSMHSTSVSISGNTIDQAQVTGAPLMDFTNARLDKLSISEHNVISKPLIAENLSTIEFGAGKWQKVGGETADPGCGRHDSHARPCPDAKWVTTPDTTLIQAMTIKGNEFIGVQATAAGVTESPGSGTAIGREEFGFIHLPTMVRPGRFAAKQSGIVSGMIQENRFIAEVAHMPAIYWKERDQKQQVETIGQKPTSSGVIIADNHFDGWGDNDHSTIRLRGTGALTVERNTFGLKTATVLTKLEDTPRQETDGTAMGALIFENAYNGANRKMKPWFPGARADRTQDQYNYWVGGGQSKPLTPVAGTCTIPLRVYRPKQGDQSADVLAHVAMPPVKMDVYWTSGVAAEVYIGTFDVSTETRDKNSGSPWRDLTYTDLSVPIPTSPADPAFDHLRVNGVLPPDAKLPTDEGGKLSGGLRVQTHAPDYVQDDTDWGSSTLVYPSSQYSRVATIGGTCAPTLTINQAGAQSDPTMGRDIHFTAVSTRPIDPTTVDLSDFSLVGSTAPGATLVSATVAKDGLSIDVVVRANDGGDLSVGVPDPQAFVSADGTALPIGAAASTDNTVKYVNPLSVSPSAFPVVMGDAEGTDYAIQIDPAAPAPTSELAFVATVDQVGIDHGLVVSPTAPILAVGRRSVSVKVTAPERPVTDNTITRIAHTVTSLDPNYDGLIVPSASPRLYANNPMIRITEAAYTDVSGPNTVDGVTGTGTRVRPGAHIDDGTPVWFVFTVDNTSADDMATVLTDVVVTDDVLGDIGTVPRLEAGQSVSLVYAANPVRLAANGPASEGGR
jgi:hypothetical protein